MLFTNDCLLAPMVPVSATCFVERLGAISSELLFQETSHGLFIYGPAFLPHMTEAHEWTVLDLAESIRQLLPADKICEAYLVDAQGKGLGKLHITHSRILDVPLSPS